MKYEVYPVLNCICIPESELKNYVLNVKKNTITINGNDGSSLFLDCVQSVVLAEDLFYVYYEDNKPFMYVEDDESNEESLDDFYNGYF